MKKEDSFEEELAAIKEIHDALVRLPEARRKFVLGVVMERLEISAELRWFSSGTPGDAVATPAPSGGKTVPVGAATVTVKDFLKEKMPRTDVERVACLGYFLDKYRGEKNFKTRDLTKLNLEAAWPNFSNAATAVSNAHKLSGYVMPAGGGKKQLTIKGETLVGALPDRGAVTQALAALGKGSAWGPKSRTKKADGSERKNG